MSNISLDQLKARSERFRKIATEIDERAKAIASDFNARAEAIDAFSNQPGAEGVLAELVGSAVSTKLVDDSISAKIVDFLQSLRTEFGVVEETPTPAPKTGKKRGRPANPAKVTTPKKPKAVSTKVKKAKSTEKQIRKTRAGQQTLKSLILEILAGKSSGLRLPEIVEQVLKHGYKSNSKKFSLVVYQNLYSLLNKEHKIDSNEDRYTIKAA